MFVAMNRFSVSRGRSDDFERAVFNRESRLNTANGFVRFALLRGDAEGEYVSHTTWVSRAAFEAWTHSESFRAGHRGGVDEGTLTGHPVVSLYENIFEQEASA